MCIVKMASVELASFGTNNPHPPPLAFQVNINTTMAAFDNIPLDLTGLIVDFLELEAFCQLRLVCREIRHDTENFFAQRYFGTVSMMLTEESVLALRDISNHDVFRRYVKRVDVCVDEVCPQLVYGKCCPEYSHQTR